MVKPNSMPIHAWRVIGKTLCGLPLPERGRQAYSYTAVFVGRDARMQSHPEEVTCEKCKEALK